ncbi:hypothetical protein AB0H71_02025 [Nocardia sp. NPDC050697]|uniref:hypothetical protein n=1 Tax=Nocardia sp. NPDC050697 TaxID=3155158 RepID=UPI0033CD5F94
MVISGVLLAAVVARVVPASAPAHRGRSRFDRLGAVLLATALITLLLPLSKGGQWGWTSAATLMCAGTGVVVLGLWVPLQLRGHAPLVNVRVTA